jgi:hypothetical protein
MTLSSALPIVLLALLLPELRERTISVNAAICLLAVRSRSLRDRRSDLQARHTALACCERHGLIGSDTVDPAIS